MLLDWNGAGYHGFGDAEFEGGDNVSSWKQFAKILHHCKQGDFSLVPELIELYDNCESWTLGRACCDLMGGAGSQALFERLLPMVEGVVEPTYSVEWGRVLCHWGSLLAVPSLIAAIRRLQGWDDVADLSSDVLDVLAEPSEWGSVDLNDTREVASACEDFYRGALETMQEQDIVFRGKVFSGARLASALDLTLMRYAKGECVLPEVRTLRQRLEGYTGDNFGVFHTAAGINVPGFQSLLQPAHFLRYQAGVRYFFGHRVP